MRKHLRLQILIISIICTILTLCSCDYTDFFNSKLLSDVVSIHYIDVGQGDSEFITFPTGETMLIDAGTNNSKDAICKLIDSLNVDKIDYVIATHPHADHIGSLADIIKAYEIGNVYMPKASTNTKTFENLLITIKDKGLSVNTAKAGDLIFEKDNLKAEFLAPSSSEYEDLNNYSAVVKISYINKSFLFTGDAESLSENEMLKSGADLSADVLKVGHHGSNTSTTKKFLDAVSPTYAIISCGVDNTYSHPSEKILNRLLENDINIFRTDKQGTISLVSDGYNIEFEKKFWKE